MYITVKELIAILQEKDPDAWIFLEHNQDKERDSFLMTKIEDGDLPTGIKTITLG